MSLHFVRKKIYLGGYSLGSARTKTTVRRRRGNRNRRSKNKNKNQNKSNNKNKVAKKLGKKRLMIL